MGRRQIYICNCRLLCITANQTKLYTVKELHVLAEVDHKSEEIKHDNEDGQNKGICEDRQNK